MAPEALPVFEELFRSACPKFISPTPPDFDTPALNVDLYLSSFQAAWPYCASVAPMHAIQFTSFPHKFQSGSCFWVTQWRSEVPKSVQEW